jgi:hypothetical protein
MYSKWLFQSGFLTEAFYCAQYALLSHPPWYDGAIIWWGVRKLEVLLCSVLQPSVTASLLSPNFFLSTQFLNILRLYFSLKVRDEISYPKADDALVPFVCVKRVFLNGNQTILDRMVKNTRRQNITVYKYHRHYDFLYISWTLQHM